LAAETGGPLAKVGGNVERQGVMDNAIWFQVYGIQAVFLIDSPSISQRSKALDLLNKAAKSHREIIVGFDPSGGTIDPASASPYFRAARIDFEQDRVVLDAPNTPLDRPTLNTPAAKSLAAGVGLRYSGDWDAAKAALDRALSDSALPPALKVLAYSNLAQMAEQRADGDYHPGTIGYDQLLIEALGDYRAEQAVGLPLVGMTLRVAVLLAELGDYDDAIEETGAAAPKYPDGALWTAITVAMIRRGQGRYDDSLAALDQLARAKGPMGGMAFHYHRGWTLLEMGRNAEAADEFTTGLKFQPDYAWALAKRACAYGRLGRLKDALADARAVAEVIANRPHERSFVREAVNRDWAQTVVADLSAAVAAGKPARIDSACHGFWSDGVTQRDPSSRLPKALSTPARSPAA
jgi:tetratricopeptide (TPR) repeat protein